MIGNAETASFVIGAKGVAGAVEMLRTAIVDGSANDVDFASDLVAQAADSYLGNSVTYQKKKFDEIADTKTTAQQERGAGDLMTSALVDLEVANTLLAAAQAASPEGSEAALSELDTSSARLNKLVNKVALPLGRQETKISTARFGFDSTLAVAVSPISSVDIVAAKTNYEKQVADVFASLVSDSKKIVLAGFEAIRNLSFQELLNSLGGVGKVALKIPQVSRVVTKAIEIISRAIEKICSVLSVQHRLETVRDIAQRVQEYIKDPAKSLDDLLAVIFGVNAAKARVRDMIGSTSAPKEAIDNGAVELMQLRSRFGEQMSVVGLIIDGVTTAKSITGFFLPAASTDVIFGSLHVLSISYTVMAGMDFADIEGSPNFVQGIIGISENTLN